MVIKISNHIKEDVSDFKAYKDELANFANKVKADFGAIAYKNGYQMHYKPYFHPTSINGRYLPTVCLDLDEVNYKADMNKLDKALRSYFRNLEYKFFIEELPRVKRICIYK